METANSKRNQHIKGLFVEEHVKANVTMLVEYILNAEDSQAPFRRSDIINGYYYRDSEGSFYSAREHVWLIDDYTDQLEELLACDSADLDANDLANRDWLEHMIQELESATPHCMEPLSWWLVSEWLANHLRSNDENVLSDGINHYWGRLRAGQAIKMDEVIHNICEQIGILEGQPNEWK